MTSPLGVIFATSSVAEETMTHMLPSGPAAILLFVSSPETLNSPATVGTASAGAAKKAAISTPRTSERRPILRTTAESLMGGPPSHP